MGVPDFYRKTRAKSGLQTVVSPEDPVMEYVAMDLLHLQEGETTELRYDAREVGVVILGGGCQLDWDNSTVKLEAREGPLEGWPHAAYIPPGKKVSVTALEEVEAAIFTAPATRQGEVHIIEPNDLEVLSIGEGNWFLQGTFIIYENIPSERLIVGETHIPAGNWSSSPPHSHDKERPNEETKLEEIYYFRFRPSQGFGFQAIYTPDQELNEAYIIRDGDVMLIPKGMHPNVAGPGYEMYMLWGMAGPRKEWIPYEDPDHSWLGSVRG